MKVLVDTGVLLRLFDRADSDRPQIVSAFRKLRSEGHELVTTAQNIAEFWNVATRPTSARGGFGWSVGIVEQRVRYIERTVPLIGFGRLTYDHWRSLLTAHQLIGLSIHDARIVAVMLSEGKQHLLTLNPADFKRYKDIVVWTPADVLASTL
jgi:predicted nucleic acid-binding protein